MTSQNGELDYEQNGKDEHPKTGFPIPSGEQLDVAVRDESEGNSIPSSTPSAAWPGITTLGAYSVILASIRAFG